METLEEVLAHHGIRGMKWGVRKRRGSDGKVSGGSTSTPPHVSEDAMLARTAHETVKKHGSTDPLSNKDLQHLVNRINLEQQYNKLTTQPSKVNKGAKIAGSILANVGKQLAAEIVKGHATKALAKAGALKK